MMVKRYLREDEAEVQDRGWNILVLHSRMPFEDTA